jgi:hypothetical protein
MTGSVLVVEGGASLAGPLGIRSHIEATFGRAAGEGQGPPT